VYACGDADKRSLGVEWRSITGPTPREKARMIGAFAVPRCPLFPMGKGTKPQPPRLFQSLKMEDVKSVDTITKSIKDSEERVEVARDVEIPAAPLKNATDARVRLKAALEQVSPNILSPVASLTSS
jgi:hypothetical protein